MAPVVKLKIHVLGIETYTANDAMHCPIASQLKESDEDIHHPYVTRETISFSRHSTGKRYTYYTPRNGKRFIDDTDDDATKAQAFLLHLTDAQLLSEAEVRVRQPHPTKPGQKRKSLGTNRDNGNRRFRGSIRVTDPETGTEQRQSTTVVRRSPHKVVSQPAPARTASEGSSPSTPRAKAVKAAKAPLRRTRRS